MKNLHASLFDQKTNQLRREFAEFTNCPVCHSEKSHEIFEKDGFHYHRCDKCSMFFMNPRLNAEATTSFYNSDVNRIYNEQKFDAVTESTTIDDSRNVENVRLLNGFTARNKVSGRKLLEIGCAKGVFLKSAQESGYEVHGLELNKENCEFANKLVEGNVHAIDLFDMKYDSETFDVVYMRDVIEHIHNPEPFLKEISRILKMGGVLFLETHNIESLINRVVGRRHSVIFGFEHPVHWSPHTISLILERTGLEMREVDFKSIDFTLRAISRYFIYPSFTTIFPPPPLMGIVRLFFKVLFFLTSRAPLRQLDEAIIPVIANSLRAGSTMKVFAIKK